MAPHLVNASGVLLLTWTEPTAGAVKMAWLKGDLWGRPRTVAQTKALFGNWADYAGVVALPGGWLLGHWREKEGTGKYAYGVRLGLSKNAGRSWTALGAPHLDATETEHGFVSLAPDDRGGAWAYWLDGRAFAAKPPGPMALRRAYLSAEGVVGPSEVVDDRVCDCCATNAAAGTLVYRDRTKGEVRDISAVTAAGVRPVSKDGWVVEGCPVNGPAIAASGDHLVTAWYTQAGGSPRALLARSTDKGKSWSAPIEVVGGSGLGRLGIALDERGDAYVSWLDGGSDRAGHDATIRVRRVSPKGAVGKSVAVVATSASRASGVPQMALYGERLVFAWTDTRKPLSIRLGSLPVAEIPRAADPVRLPPGMAGRVVVANLWSLTCAPCMEELPLLAKLHKKLAKQGGTVLGINVDPQQAEMRAEANRLGLPFPIVHDPEGKFGLTATILPTTVVFDRSGKQLLRLQRPIKVDDPELKAALQKAGLDL